MLIKILLLPFLVVVKFLDTTSACITDGGPFSYTNVPNIVCTTETTFQFVDASGNIIPNAVTYTCPSGQVCADIVGACGSAASTTPVCTTPAVCGDCTGSVFTCVSPNAFVVCSNGQRTSFTQTCPSSTPNCQVASRTSNTVPCASSTTTSDCTTAIDTTTAATTQTTTTDASVACSGQTGTRAVETSCQAYFYCYMDGDTMRRVDYTCPGTYVFNRNTGKCVHPSQYSCPVSG